MAAWWELDDLTVEMAFGDSPLATTPTYTDVTAYVFDIPSLFRGRTSEYDDFAPGTCELRLRNNDRRFDPDYSAGPYFGDLVPMVRVRVKATLGATTVVLFVGFILGWSQKWEQTTGTVTVTAVDGSRFVQNSPLGESAMQIAILDQGPFGYWPMQESGDPYQDVAGFGAPMVPSVGGQFGSQTTTTSIEPVGANQYWTSADVALSTSLTVTSVAAYTEPKALEFWHTGSGAGSVDFIPYTDSYLFVRWDSTGVYVEYSNATDAKRLTASGGVKIGGRLPMDRPAHVAVVADSTNLYLAVNGETVSTTALSAPDTTRSFVRPAASVSTDSDSGVSHVAVYGAGILSGISDLSAHYRVALAFGHPYGEDGGTRIGRVLDEIGWPAGLRSIDTGDTVHGPYLPAGQKALDYIRQVELVEQGLFFFDLTGQAIFRSRNTLWTQTPVATFSDDGGAGAITFVELDTGGNHVDTIRNIATVSYSTVGAITNRDATSVTNYGEAREFIDGPTLPDGRSASTLGQYIVRERKDPKTTIPRLVASMRKLGGDNEFETLAAIDVGDLITVEHTPIGVGSQSSRSLLVQGIEHSIGLEAWYVTLYLSPSPTLYTAGPYLTMGDATYGQIGATAGNLIPY